MKGVSLSCLVPRTTRPLWSNLPAVCAWRTREACHLSRSIQGRRQCSQWRGRERPPFPPLTLMASRYRCIPAISEMHALPPSGLPMLDSGNSIFVLLSTPQILCLAWSNVVQTYIFSFITCHYLQLMTLWCNHSRLLTWNSFFTSFSWKTPTEKSTLLKRLPTV